ncbi:prepilin peptidase [Miltoncostaea oceani]|uniref:prepilin peptidase n=1 Tax=Miltoncostaea oceani TaxID=2843216 RepID=UPI001C3E4222|nr:A24 family peptidase [Miltoncostaea oceani]
MLLGAPTAYWAFVAGLFGLCLGSFSTVVASRWPAEQSLVHPRSHCTTCDRTLGPLELVPVLSWLALRGHCRGCGEGVSWRYPAIELASGGLAAAAIAGFGPTWEGLAAALLGVALVPVVVIDLEHRLIPSIIVFPAFALAIAATIAADPARWWVPVAAALGAFAFLYVLWFLYPAGMGRGDANLALLLGAVLGASVLPALFIAFALGAALGVALLARFGARARKMAVPFGPFLAAGALVALWLGPSMIGWYAGTLG